MSLIIREYSLSEDLNLLTDLLHRAYADLAVRGLHYGASQQSPDITERRIRSAKCFVAEESGRLVGTITVQRSRPKAQVPLYREKGVMIIGQFGVEADMRGRGIGRALHEQALKYALASGAHTMALDTAAPATELIQTYQRWGYREVGRHTWKSKNYESVVMKKEMKSFSPEFLAEKLCTSIMLAFKGFVVFCRRFL